MEPQLDSATLTDAVLETIRANEFKACYIRPIVYRGYHALGVNPFPCPVDTAILLLGVGRVSRPGRAEQRRRRASQLVDRAGAQHLPDAGEDARPTTPTRS